ncbi:MAG: single-stranded-DNA-specific exonuclease RecJ [Oscillospiraceae bacterium]|jgi:single-stranded-DNA-specific exonuclease|nr:single-stranded-DNA-specific exonuclease RecJ [Oscillospiraceae bacterium]
MKFKQWNDLPSTPAGALEDAGVPALCARVLRARGMTDPAEARRFLYEEPLLHDPMEMRDMDKAVTRLRQALTTGETIAVYGDYDVDGITAASLLTLFLRGEGATVLPYIPNRLEEGYGLNQAAVEKLVSQGARVVVTVDCGITAVEETDQANALGLDVIITDHHECKDSLPDALAVVDPHRPDCPYPFKCLAGVGVALKLCLALAGPEREGELLESYADLCALGTVADVMSLTDENRTIVRRGLAALPHTSRPGLLALLRESGAEGKALSSTLVGYTLAPRINAAGRMGCSEIALELLLTSDPHRGEELAQTLCSLNRQRQELEADIFSQCDLLVDALPSNERDALVLAGDSWHQGVVGIVASRLTEKYAVPAFMICLNEGRGKGSCRSYGDVNLFTLLEGCADLLEAYGGHELAAGFTIPEENIPSFRSRINELTRQARQEKPPVTTLTVDCVLPDPSLLTQEEVEQLSLLEPYGPGNPRPVFRLDRCAITGLTQVGNGKHMKLKLSSGGRVLDAIFFSATAEEAGISPDQRVDLCFSPQINEYKGWRNVQLQVSDLRPARTRAQVEEELFRRLMAGETLSPGEARSLIPTRQEFANLWKYLYARREEGEIEETASRLARNVARSCGLREEFMRTQVCLTVFHDRGLIHLEQAADHLRLHVLPTQGKADLEAAPIMQTLRKMAEGENG